MVVVIGECAAARAKAQGGKIHPWLAPRRTVTEGYIEDEMRKLSFALSRTRLNFSRIYTRAFPQYTEAINLVRSERFVFYAYIYIHAL